MKKNNAFTLILLMMASFVVSSCLKDDNKEVVLYDDTAVVSFALSNISIPKVIKTAAGKDSVVTATFKGTDFPFYIDQKSNTIWNPDSLPYDAPVKTLLCNISTVRGSVAGFYVDESDKDKGAKAWSYTDSVDLSTDRHLLVMSSSGKYMREYLVRVNTHKLPDGIHWTQLPSQSAFTAFAAGMKAVAVGGRVYLMGSDGNNTSAYVLTASNDWKQVATGLGSDAYLSAIAADAPYTVSDGKVLRGSADGFAPVGSADGVQQLIGASANQMFALAADKSILVSTDKGCTWVADTLASAANAAKLPASNISFITRPQIANPNNIRDIIVAWGAEEADTAAVVWTKIENEKPGFAGWDFNDTHTSQYFNYLPKLNNLVVVAKDDVLMAMGLGTASGAQQPFATIWESRDQGLSWFKSKRYSFPEAFDKTATSFAAAVADGRLWIITNAGQVWCAE